ncbi:hypothetical protein BC833DRAFT_530096, partial [Globomyces pollinis-pini]
DRNAVINAKNEFMQEQLVRANEVAYVRDKLKWCYRREGVNHFQNCRELSMQYLDLMKEYRGGFFKGFKLPYPETPVESDHH